MIRLSLVLTQPGHEDSACWCVCGGGVPSSAIPCTLNGWGGGGRRWSSASQVWGEGAEVSNGEKGTGRAIAERAFAGSHLLFLLSLHGVGATLKLSVAYAAKSSVRRTCCYTGRP